MLPPDLGSPRLLRIVLISLFLFLLPAVYIDSHASIWTSRFTAAAIRPSPQEATLLIKGLSFSQATKPAIAVCITQETKTAPHPSLYRSINRHIIQVLKHSGYAVHVFLHLSRTKSSKCLSPSLQRAVRILQPVRIAYHSRKESCPLARCATTGVTCPLTLLHSQQCYNHIVAYERRTGVTFDWVYKTRLNVALGANITTPQNLDEDVVYTNQHNPNATIHTHAVLRTMFPHHAHVISGPVSNYLYALSRSTADTVFNAVDAFRECALYDLPRGMADDEVGFLYWLVSRGIKYKTMPWFWMFINRASVPDCSRVRWIRNENGIRDPSFSKLCHYYKRTKVIRDPEKIHLHLPR